MYWIKVLLGFVDDVFIYCILILFLLFVMVFGNVMVSSFVW